MEAPIAYLHPAPYVTVALAATITGLSEKAIRRKIEVGKWIEGREWVRSPDGSIFISMKGFERWVEGAHVGSKQKSRRDAPHSGTKPV